MAQCPLNFLTFAVLTSLAAPTFTQEPSDVEADIGSNVTLLCHTQGYPEPQVTWRRDDGLPIFNRPRTHGTIRQNREHLQITCEFFLVRCGHAH